MMVTPLQLARAFCVFANGGHLIKPCLIKGRLAADGKVAEQYPAARLETCPQVIDEPSANLMRQIMSDVLVRGTATKARSKYWNLFGKTGTSHISRNGHYVSNLFNSSFMCGGPLEHPRVVVTMIIHEPDRSLGHYGGTVSAPAAGRLLERTLAYLQEPPSPPLAPPPANVIPVLYNFRANLYGENHETVAER